MVTIEPGTAAPPFDIEYVNSVEAEIGIRFPASFLDFMKASNGGVPVPQFLNLGANNHVVERLLSFVPDYKTNELGCYDIEVVWSQIEGRLTDDLCPFAALFAGDFLCFKIDSEGEAEVVLWDHESSEEGAPALIPVAESFESLLNMLHR